MANPIVLVVDDDRSSADTTVMAIQKFSGNKISAEAIYGGKECLLRLEREPAIQLILLDLNMPEVNGADVIRRLLKKVTAVRFRILMTTAWGTDWVKHWNLSDLAPTPDFRRLVLSETCDKANDLSELVDQVRRAVEEVPR